jgi:hypothetical protein
LLIVQELNVTSGCGDGEHGRYLRHSRFHGLIAASLPLVKEMPGLLFQLAVQETNLRPHQEKSCAYYARERTQPGN